MSALKVTRFSIHFQTLSPIQLPDYAGSTLRGAFGHALKNMACLTASRNKGVCCCQPVESCIYRRLFDVEEQILGDGRKQDIAPPLMIEPVFRKKRFAAGEAASFNMVLIGEFVHNQLAIIQLAWQRALYEGIGLKDAQGKRGTAQLTHVALLDQPVAQMPANPQHIQLQLLSPLRLSDLLVQQGHVVEVAQTSNQPVWDLLVDGQAVNVKTVQDIAEIKAAALAHPDVIYLVPEDAAGVAGDNIVRLDGFSHQQLSELTDQSIDHAMNAGDSLGDIASHLPVVPLFFSIMRNRKAVAQGREQAVAVRHVLLDTLGRGGGAAFGALLGGSIGALAGPPGILVGTALGGILGSLFGRQMAENIKRMPLEQAIAQFDTQLQQFGAGYASRLARVIQLLYRPYARQQKAMEKLSHLFELQKKQWRWWLFPSFYSVLLEQTRQHAQDQLQQQQHVLSGIKVRLPQAHAQGDYRPLGLVLLNIPHLREVLGVDLIALRLIQQQREAVYHQRSQLHPEVFPPRQKQHGHLIDRPIVNMPL